MMRPAAFCNLCMKSLISTLWCVLHSQHAVDQNTIQFLSVYVSTYPASCCWSICLLEFTRCQHLVQIFGMYVCCLMKHQRKCQVVMEAHQVQCPGKVWLRNSSASKLCLDPVSSHEIKLRAALTPLVAPQKLWPFPDRLVKASLVLQKQMGHAGMARCCSHKECLPSKLLPSSIHPSIKSAGFGQSPS
jgi:hypothetical protein